MLHFIDHPVYGFKWDYIVTGGNYNSEIKLWRTSNLDLLQIIKFESFDPCYFLKRDKMYLSSCIDKGSKFLLLADFRRNNLYYLNIQYDTFSDSIYINSLTEFKTNNPLLSVEIKSVDKNKDHILYTFNDDQRLLKKNNMMRSYKSLDEFYVNNKGAWNISKLRVFSIQCNAFQEVELELDDRRIKFNNEAR